MSAAAIVLGVVVVFISLLCIRAMVRNGLVYNERIKIIDEIHAVAGTDVNRALCMYDIFHESTITYDHMMNSFYPVKKLANELRMEIGLNEH